MKEKESPIHQGRLSHRQRRLLRRAIRYSNPVETRGAITRGPKGLGQPPDHPMEEWAPMSPGTPIRQGASAREQYDMASPVQNTESRQRDREQLQREIDDLKETIKKLMENKS